jgi:GNAT superfamily N-acetyltransferase
VKVASSSVLVRRARPADLEALLGLYEELAVGRAAAAPTDLVTSQRSFAELLADQSRHLVVAIVDGRVVGTADLLVVANLTHHGKPWAIVENVIVADAFRRSGVGRELMQHLIELARGAGCYKLQLISGKQRTGAHALYEGLGLEPVAEGFKIYFEP